MCLAVYAIIAVSALLEGGPGSRAPWRVISGWRRAPALWALLVAGLMTVAPADAATIWNGPPIIFTKADNANANLPANQDRLTANVWLTRGSSMGLFNIAKEPSYGVTRPADSAWSYGTSGNYTTLKYAPWVMFNGQSPPSMVGKDAVVHLISDDIYVDIKFASLTNGGGGFSYQRSTPSGGGPATANAIEYYHQEFDHYFITSNPDEITKLDNGTFVGWVRTGLSFKVYPTAVAGANSVCRFFSTAFDPKSSHFYTPFPAECATVKTNPNWQFEGEGTQVFFIPVAAGDGTCPAGTLSVYRLYNNGMGGAPNHRFTVLSNVRDQMLSAGWVIEGNGPGLASMCSPV
jgi:hypothetical protein